MIPTIPHIKINPIIHMVFSSMVIRVDSLISNIAVIINVTVQIKAIIKNKSEN